MSQVGLVLGLDLLGFAEDHNGLHRGTLGTFTRVAETALHFPKIPLTDNLGENTFMSWAKIVDCGDVRMTFLDNRIALKQLEKAHEVDPSPQLHSVLPLIVLDHLWTAILHSGERPYTTYRRSGW